MLRSKESRFFYIVTYQSSNVNFRPWTTLTFSLHSTSHTNIQQRHFKSYFFREILTHHSPHIIFFIKRTDFKIEILCLSYHAFTINEYHTHFMYDVTLLNFFLYEQGIRFLFPLHDILFNRKIKITGNCKKYIISTF